MSAWEPVNKKTVDYLNEFGQPDRFTTEFTESLLVPGGTLFKVVRRSDMDSTPDAVSMCFVPFAAPACQVHDLPVSPADDGCTCGLSK